MKGLSEFTGRNVIAYYSSWLNKHSILSLHHAYMITLDALPVIKIIESQNGKSMISSMQSAR